MSAAHVIEGSEALFTAVGEELGLGDWFTVTQQTINDFAEATGDAQWIHLDTRRAASGPFGTTIAHGYLTISLLPMLAKSVYEIAGFAMKVNYGLEKVRFPEPVRSGDKVRLRAKLVSANTLSKGIQVVVENTIEIEGREKPGCIAQTVSILIPHI